MSRLPLAALLDQLAEYARSPRAAPPRVIAYGSDPQQFAELRLPAGDGPHPVAVLVHGGFWRAAWDRTLMDALAVDLALRGWASWNVEYRRVGNGGGVPQTLDDVAAAIDALTTARPALPHGQLTVIGHSAGGQLALCLRDRPEIERIVSLAGVCDLRTGFAARIGEGAVAEFAGGGPDTNPEAYAAADPLTRLPARGPAKVLLVHGDADDRVPASQSRRYAAAGGGELLELRGVDHFSLIDPRSPAWGTVAGRFAGPPAR